MNGQQDVCDGRGGCERAGLGPLGLWLLTSDLCGSDSGKVQGGGGIGILGTEGMIAKLGRGRKPLS